jgi:hypothetical protein
MTVPTPDTGLPPFDQYRATFAPSSQAGLASHAGPVPYGPPPVDDEDDLPPLPDLLDALEQMCEALDLIGEHLAAHRNQTVDDAARSALHAVGDNTARSWAHARLALTDMREALAVPPAAACGATVADRQDMWWTCQRTAGHAGLHQSSDRTWSRP